MKSLTEQLWFEVPGRVGKQIQADGTFQIARIEIYDVGGAPVEDSFFKWNPPVGTAVPANGILVAVISDRRQSRLECAPTGLPRLNLKPEGNCFSKKVIASSRGFGDFLNLTRAFWRVEVLLLDQVAILNDIRAEQAWGAIKAKTNMNPSRLILALGVLLSWLGLASRASADVDIVNNLSETTGGNDSRALDFGQVFTTPGFSAQMSGLTVSIGASTASETATFYLYATDSGGAPTGSGTSLGNLTISAAGNYGLSLSSGPNLAANTSYAIVMSNPTGAGGPEFWNWTASSTSGVTGTPALGGIYRGSAHGGGAQTWTQIDSGEFFQMEIQTVPEVPLTGAFMGLGALAIAACQVGGSKLKNFPNLKTGFHIPMIW